MMINPRYQILNDRDFWLRLEFDVSDYLSQSPDNTIRKYWIDGFIPASASNILTGLNVEGEVWIVEGRRSQTKCRFLARIPQSLLHRTIRDFEFEITVFDPSRKYLELEISKRILSNPSTETPYVDAIKIRRGKTSDAAAISALAIQVFLDTYATEGVRPDLAVEAFTVYSEQKFLARLQEPERCFLLAVREDGLLGFAELLAGVYPVPGCEETGSELVRLYVQPRAQRQNIGQRLLQKAERVAQELAANSLWFTVWEKNTQALAFYTRQGFTVVGETIYQFQDHTYGNKILFKDRQ